MENSINFFFFFFETTPNKDIFYQSSSSVSASASSFSHSQISVNLSVSLLGPSHGHGHVQTGEGGQPVHGEAGTTVFILLNIIIIVQHPSNVGCVTGVHHKA